MLILWKHLLQLKIWLFRFLLETHLLLDEKFIKAELLFSGYICEHNLSKATADHVGKLFKTIFPHSKIAKNTIVVEPRQHIFLSGDVVKESIIWFKVDYGLVLPPMGVAMKMTSFCLYLSGNKWSCYNIFNTHAWYWYWQCLKHTLTC